MYTHLKSNQTHTHTKKKTIANTGGGGGGGGLPPRPTPGGIRANNTTEKPRPPPPGHGRGAPPPGKRLSTGGPSSKSPKATPVIGGLPKPPPSPVQKGNSAPWNSGGGGGGLGGGGLPPPPETPKTPTAGGGFKSGNSKLVIWVTGNTQKWKINTVKKGLSLSDDIFKCVDTTNEAEVLIKSHGNSDNIYVIAHEESNENFFQNIQNNHSIKNQNICVWIKQQFKPPKWASGMEHITNEKQVNDFVKKYV